MSPVQTPTGKASVQPDESLERLLRAALEEDIGSGDLTTEGLVPEEARARARLHAKEAGVVAGLEVFARVFLLLDPRLRVRARARDGERVEPGAVLMELEGRARALLGGERTALNLVQRLSGIATLTARFVQAAGGRARILDTRKTTPGLRALEKHAVRCGGGENHRSGLWDQVLIKNNHVDLTGRSPEELVRALRARHGEAPCITAEARDRREALSAIAGGADVVLLDNLSPRELAELCPGLRAAAAGRGRPLELEASGGITLDNVADFAASGVDRLSIGALTHSISALDLSLAIERLQ